MAGVEEARSPEAGVEWLAAAVFTNHDNKVGEIGIVGAEAVGKPRPEAGTSRDLRASLDEGDGGIVIDGIGVDIAHDANIVSDFLRPGEEVGIHLLTGFAKLAKLEDRAGHGLG